MTQSPIIPQVMPNLEFIEHYLESLENLPLDVQRLVSQIREYDLLYKSKVDAIGRYLCLYQGDATGPSKRKYLDKIQRCLIKSQHYGDMKLHLISQIVDLVDSRSQQLLRDAQSGYLDRKEEEDKKITNNSNSAINKSIKVEKPTKPVVEKPSTKSLYDKPKRVRRVRATDKLGDKNQRGNNNPSRGSNKADEEEEDAPMEDEDEEDTPEAKPKKESKKTKDREAKNKDKEKIATEKDEKEEKKTERKEKHTSGKITKKTNIKVQAKIKKQKKKKEKEILPEDIAIDPDEPTYCICNRISYGDMIGCDNDSCVIEWFHFDCVNLTHKPKGKWYCPPCTTERKEKNKK